MASVNQQLIAEKLNLSRTTVSRSLANHPAISADTRAKVQQLAASIGYRGNPARTLRRPRQSRPVSIGVLIGVPAKDVAMATFPFILQGIRERAAVEHLAIDVSYENPAGLQSGGQRQAIFGNIRRGDWRGAILIYPFPEPAVETIARKISAVAVLATYATPGIDMIDTDDSTGVLALVARLAAAGHRKIGFLSWTREYPIASHWAVRRFGGYVEALFALGLPFHPEWTFNVRKDVPPLAADELTPQVARLIREQGVRAWVCAADHQAYHLMRGLAALGLRVPQDCSVTGFDGLEPPEGQKRLASIRVPHEDIGSSALARVLNRIMDPNSPRRKILVEGECVEGETLAPPPPA